ncbi:MAG: hypothetical protein CVU57_28805 [Deltaproteobacteria bacterium HGW-Deltaproteobacteria-15]|nr:MAG: hypothetical protein CVU57_28805 [Deltaproteobacteria bacterium HGW-Deltaproteobacteria-15]
MVLSLISASLGQGFWANTVFCISGAEHAVFEPVHNGGHAVSPGEFKGSPRIYELSSGPGFDSCSDIPVFKIDSYQRPSFEGNPIPGNPSLLSAARGEISDDGVRSFYVPKQTPDFFTATLLSLRATILLI